MGDTILFWLGSIVLTVVVGLLSPFVASCCWKVSGLLSGVQGPGLGREYGHLVKLLGRETVVTSGTSLFILRAPALNAVLLLTAVCVLMALIVWPDGHRQSHVILGYILAVDWAVLVLTLAESTRSVGIFRCLRAMMLQVLCLPSVIMALVTLDLWQRQKGIETGPWEYPPVFFAWLSLLCGILAVNFRSHNISPADYGDFSRNRPDTSVFYNGWMLGIVRWTQAIRLTLYLMLAAGLVFPVPGVLLAYGKNPFIQATIACTYFLVKLAGVVILVAWLENTQSRYKLSMIPRVLMLGLASAVLGLVLVVWM